MQTLCTVIESAYIRVNFFSFKIGETCILTTFVDQKLSLLGAIYMRKLAPARVSYRDDFLFCIAFTLSLGHFISRYLKVHFMLIKYTCDSKSQTLRMRYPFQSTGRPISHRNVWSFRVYAIPLLEFVPEWNSRPGKVTGVNSRRGDSRRHDILWWYHVSKCRAMRENRSELTPAWKSPRCHVNSLSVYSKSTYDSLVWLGLIDLSKLLKKISDCRSFSFLKILTG